MSARAAFLSLLLLGAAACSNAPAGQPEAAYRRGLEALQKGEPKTARIEFLNAIKADPNNRDVRLAQARTYLMLRDGAAAEAELRRARELGAPQGETGHLMAYALLLQGQARPAVGEAQKAAPQHAAFANRMLGRAWAALGDADSAASAFTNALSRAPDDSALWSDIGRFRWSTGETAGAIEAADRAVSLDPENVEAVALRAELTRSQYGLAAAMPWFDRAVEIDPSYVPAIVERAATLGELGRAKEMLAETRRILALSPNNPNAWFLQSVLAARGGRYDLARRLFDRAKGALDERPSAILLGGIIELQSGTPVQAAKRFQRLLRLQPANLKARRLLGAALWRSGDAAGAIGTLRPIVERPDADAYSLTLAGRSLAKLGDAAGAARYLARAAAPPPAAGTVLADPFEEAQVQALRRAAESAPGEAKAQVEYIRALLGRGRGAEALERSRRLQAANPGAPDAHLLVGDAFAVQGDYRSAAAAYRKAANLAFNEPTALRLIEALRNSGDRKAAAQVLGLFLAQNPQNVEAQLLAGNAYLQARQWGAAIELYERVRRRIGNADATLLNNLAWAYSETGEEERALPLARRAWELDPYNPATADTLGWLLYRSGKKAEGLSFLEQAAKGAPSDAEILAHLKRARAS